MGRYMKQEQTRSELQQRLAADLRAKAAARHNNEGETVDIEDSRYMEGSKATTKLAWLWAIIVIAAIAIFVGLAYLAFTSMNQV